MSKKDTSTLDVIDESGAAEHDQARRDDARRRSIPTKPEDVRVFDSGMSYAAYGADGKLITHPNRDALIDQVLGINRKAAAAQAARQDREAWEATRKAEAATQLPGAQEAARDAQEAVRAAHDALVAAVVAWQDVTTAWVNYRTAERRHDRARHKVTRLTAQSTHGGDGPGLRPAPRYQTLPDALERIAEEQVRAVDLDATSAGDSDTADSTTATDEK